MKKLTILMAVVLLAVGTVSFAGPRGSGRGGQGWGDGMGMGAPACMPGGMGMGGRAHGCMPDGMGIGRHRDGGPFRLLGMADELGLTDDQVASLKKMATDHQLAMVDMRADLKKARIQSRALRMEDNPNENAVLKSIDEVTRLEAQLEKARFKHRQQMHSVLTQEQLDKLDDLRQKRRMNRRNPDCPLGNQQRGKKSGDAGMGG